MKCNKRTKFYFKLFLFFMSIVLIYTYGSYIFTDKNGTIRTLTGMGYKNIEITGYRWFACGRDDVVSTGFTALNREDNNVSGTAYEGLIFKYRTIRFD